MKCLLILLVLFGAGTTMNMREPACGTTLRDLWLDVVVVVDNSAGMTQAGLTKITANLASVFGTGIRIGTNSFTNKTTRVGVVTYNNVANTVANLNQINSLDDLHRIVYSDQLSVSSNQQSYLYHGLTEAEKIFSNDESYRNEFYQKVVIVYASTYRVTGKFDPVPVANRMKSHRWRIITVAFDQNGDGASLRKLGELASEGFNLTNSGSIVKPVQEALMQANCFCPNSFTQYIDENHHRYRTCIQDVSIESIWSAAKYGCQRLTPPSYLVNEYSESKHFFVHSRFNESSRYFNGLHKVNGVWRWEQPSGYGNPELEGFENWDYGYPKPDYALTSVVNVLKNDGQMRWQNVDPNEAERYICETMAYDTDYVL